MVHYRLYSILLSVLAMLVSMNLNAQQQLQIKAPSAMPSWLAELVVEANKDAPDGYEFVLYPPLVDSNAVRSNITSETKEFYIKLALPKNILKESSSVSATLRYPKSIIKTVIFDVIIENSEGKSWVISKGTPLLTGNIFVKPPETCYLDLVSFKKGKTFMTVEGDLAEFFKYVDPNNKAEKKDDEVTVRLDQIQCPATDEDSPY
jgi:hypothetical protein